MRRKRLLIAIADHSILIALAIAFLAPFVFILLTSVMTDSQALSTNLWPDPLHLSNYSEVFDAAPILTYAANSFIYAGLGDPRRDRLERPRRLRALAHSLEGARRRLRRSSW